MRGRSLGSCVALALLLLPDFALAAPHLQRVELEAGERVLGLALVDLDDDGRIDPVVASRSPVGPEAHQRRLRLFRPEAREGEPGYAMAHELDVPDDVVAYAFGDLAGRGARELIYFTATGAFRFDVTTGEAARILDGHRSLFSMPAQNQLPFWDLILDLDGDDRSDLILADEDGYVIYRQTPEHALERVGRVAAGSRFASEPTRLRERRVAADGDLEMLRAVARLCLADINADRRTDVMAMRDKDLLAFAQRPDGTFSAEPSLVHRLVSPKGVPFERLNPERVPRIAHGDVNGDGRADFVVPELDIADLVTRLRIFLSDPATTPTTPALPEQPSQILKLSSIGNEPQLVDLNGDGALDLGLATVRTDLLVNLTNPTVQTVTFSYYGFLFRRDEGRFSTRPDLKWDVSVDIPDERPREQERDDEEFMRIAGDFNADGVLDLAMMTPLGELRVYAGAVSGEDRMSVGMASDPLLQTHVKRPPSRARILDLDGDGRSDFAFQYEDSVELLFSR